MQIIILGMGCPRCQRLASNAEAAAKQLGLTYTVEEITDRERIEREFHPGALPALVLDGRIVSEGQVLETEAIVPLMTSANEAERVFVLVELGQDLVQNCEAGGDELHGVRHALAGTDVYDAIVSDPEGGGALELLQQPHALRHGEGVGVLRAGSAVGRDAEVHHDGGGGEVDTGR